MPDLTSPRHIPTLPKTDPGAGYQASDFIQAGARSFSRNGTYCLGRYRLALPRKSGRPALSSILGQVAKPVLDPGKLG